MVRPIRLWRRGLVKEWRPRNFRNPWTFPSTLVWTPRSPTRLFGLDRASSWTGKTVRVAVFAQGENADAAKEAGADIVGMDDLAESVKGES
ncbi:MAG: hypothetical protein CM1200mP36_02930 [Gammaproteobacteria bacterium]|nr:MAG: hypothetical protein CM1200mP36_02930 [Gammaproteobacteria bacterium]